MYTPISKRKKVSYKPVENRTKTPFDATKTGIAINTVKGVLGWVPAKDNPYLKVGKDILQQIARSVATVGITAGNLPTKIASKITGQDIPTPFDEEINTKDNKISKAIFGDKPVKSVQKSVEDTKKIIEPYIGETASKFSAAPLVGLGIALDLSGFGGKAKVAIKGEVPETFLRLLAKKKNITEIENILKKTGLDNLNSKSLAETLAPTKNIDEVKTILTEYKPVNERIPLGEILKKEPTITKESPIDIKFQSKIKNKEYLKKNFEDENLKIEDSGKKYVYHATNSKNIEGIKKEGLIPQKIDVISNEQGNYFALGPEAIHSVVGKNADSILRLKVDSYGYSHKNNIPKLDEEAYGDSIVFPKKISADDLEILTEDGWQPLIKKEPIKPVQERISTIKEIISKNLPKYRALKKEADFLSTKMSGIEFGQNGYKKGSAVEVEKARLEWVKVYNEYRKLDDFIEAQKDKIKELNNPNLKIEREAKDWLSSWVHSLEGRNIVSQMSNPSENVLKILDKPEYKPSKPIKVYRATYKGDKMNTHFSAWSRKKEVAMNFLDELREGSEIVEKIVSPEDIFVEINKVPKKWRPFLDEGGNESEVILKPLKEIIPKIETKESELSKSQLEEIWKKAQIKTESRIGKKITVEAPNADPITGIVERRPLNSIKPSQSGEDLFNSTSRSYAKGDIVENMYTENERPINVGKLTDPEKLPPIVIDKKGNIIDGNHRWAAAKISGLKDIDVIVKDIPEVKPKEVVLNNQPSEYVYHATAKKNLEKFEIFGMDSKYSKLGQYGKGVYVAPTPGQTKGYGGPEEIIIRTSRNNLPDNYQEFPEQGWFQGNVSSEKLEYSIDDGKTWNSVVKSKESLLPTVIQGETFTMGPATTKTATAKTAKTELKATQKEIKNAQIAAEKAAKLDAKEQKVRTDALSKLNRYRGPTDSIEGELKNKNLSQEDIENIILEDGTKFLDAAKIKRNNDGSLSTVITKKELEDIKASYTDEVPKQKWEKKSILVNAKEIPINLIKSIELPYAYFNRKGLSSIYDQVVNAQRDAEIMRNRFISKFEEAGLYKEGSWFTPNRFTLSDNESKGVAEYYLGRQGHAKEIPLTDLSANGQKFVKVFDEIISETTEPFYQVAQRMGKQPGVVENYAPIMTREDIQLVDQGGGIDWLFRKHPAFFSLKERVKNAPKDIYEKDYRQVATRWLDGITQFITMGDTTNHLKYLINSDEFTSMIKEKDLSIINNWLKDITTPNSPSTLAGTATNELSRLLRKGVALGSLGLNYATVLKQALTQIPIAIIEKSLPKAKSEYAKAFGINVHDLPSISKRTGDIAISDLQGKLGRIFTGAITKFDKTNAQTALNGLLDKEYNKFLKEGAEITPEIQKVIEKNAQDKIDMWFGGFFKGQRPEAYRNELGNFILMFTYPLASQTNGLFRHILKAKGFTGNIKAIAEVFAATVAIAYMEKVIENLTPEWSDPQEMTKDVLVSLVGNIPFAGNIAYAIATEQDINISPVIGNVNNIVRNISKGEGEKVFWNIAETVGLPKQVRRIKEGMEIIEEGGITDSNGKMVAPVQGTMEYIRAFLRGKYGPLASQDYIRNVGVDAEDRRWFYPEVEFLQNAGSAQKPNDGSYQRKAEIYRSWDKAKQKEFRNFLSEGQQKKLDKALKGEKTTKSKSLSDIFKK